MAMNIGHASLNENGTTTGGIPGDQTGKEVCVAPWYNKGWEVVLRCKDTGKANAMASACEAGCANNKIGYDMDRRNTLNTQAKTVSYNLSKITVACDCDCSSFMSVCAQAAGIDVYSSGNAPTTSSIRNAFNGTGLFQVLTDSKYLTTDANLQRGDVLVKPGYHTAMALGNGSTVTTTTFTLKYNANGGTGTMADTKVTYGVTTNLRANTFTRSSYRFTGWYAHRQSDSKWLYNSKDGSTDGWYKKDAQPSGYMMTLYTDKVGVARTSTVNNDTIIMYAQWAAVAAAVTFTLKYNANGGTGTMANTKVTYGVTTKLRKNTFSLYAHLFTGWYAHRQSDSKWLYNVKGGTTDGWYKEGSQPSNYIKTIYTDQVEVARTSSVNNDTIIMYAQWKGVSFTLKYNSNGGSGTMADTKVTYGVTTKLRKNTITRSGYKFTGWYAYRQSDSKWLYNIKGGTTDGWYKEGSQPSNYIKTIYTDQVEVARTSSVNNDIIIMYAQWKKV